MALTPWLRLFRLPNLLTVPGDPLAGFLLSGGGRLLPMLAAGGASLCLYMSGLVLNDIVDIRADRIERPGRPLPSGQITVGGAWTAAIALALAGLGFSFAAGGDALRVGGALAVMILIYNVWLKGVPVAGTLAMGGCRGLSVILGAMAARPCCTPGGHTVDFAVLSVTAYVAAFSAIARNETAAEEPKGPLRWGPFAVLLVMLPGTLLTALPVVAEGGAMPTVCVFLMCMALIRAWMLGGVLYRMQPVPDTIAGHIRNLLQIQACLCAAAGGGGLFPALFLMALWLLFPRLSRRFYSS